MLRRTTFEKKVIGLLMIVLLFVAGSAILVYLNLRSIINEITEEARPDETLIIMKEMMYDISDAENSVKSYSLTKNVSYLEQFNTKTADVDNKIQQLRKLTSDNEKHSDYVDSLDFYTKNKFVILEDLLILQDQFTVDKVLDQVIANIEQAEGSSVNEEVKVTEAEEKQGFFQRLKDKRDKKKDDEEGSGETTEDNGQSFVQLGEEVTQLKAQENKKQKKLREKEYLLIQEDKQIMDRIKAIFVLMETEENASMQNQLDNADRSSQQTKYLVAAFCLLVCILLAFAAYTIFKYVQRNNAYKKALKAAKDETELKNKEITDSIQYAKRIQNAILPDNRKVEKCIPNSFILYKPKDIVAGDFYWMMEHNDQILFAVADCTGHGVPGAMVSVVCHNSLNRSVREFGQTEPARILEKTRELVIETLEEGGSTVYDGMDIALCKFDPKTGMLEYSGAYNSLYLVKNNNLQEIRADKQPVGRYEKPGPFTNHKIGIDKGDRIFLYTDGYADQFGGPERKKFKTRTFKELLVSSSVNSLKMQKDVLNQTFESWRGDVEQIDDVCVIGVEF
ncbi:MAG: SpoIIE family protein phosphatase [Crocinitomicaceae bacterium]|nr:SpoIIE family protein phosphatase [Crocinitomicaceae bacterium]